MAVSPVSALLLLVAPVSAIRADAPTSVRLEFGSIVVIWPLVNSSSASPSRLTAPVRCPAVPKPAAVPTFSVVCCLAPPCEAQRAGVDEAARRHTRGRAERRIADVHEVVVGEGPADDQVAAAVAGEAVVHQEAAAVAEACDDRVRASCRELQGCVGVADVDGMDGDRRVDRDGVAACRSDARIIGGSGNRIWGPVRGRGPVAVAAVPENLSHDAASKTPCTCDCWKVS
jgi:hypothetical protein